MHLTNAPAVFSEKLNVDLLENIFGILFFNIFFLYIAQPLVTSESLCAHIKEVHSVASKREYKKGNFDKCTCLTKFWLISFLNLSFFAKFVHFQFFPHKFFFKFLVFRRCLLLPSVWSWCTRILPLRAQYSHFNTYSESFMKSIYFWSAIFLKCIAIQYFLSYST